MQRYRTWAGFLIAGLLFYGVFWLAYRQVDENLYANRDDGIITVSHARNFVDYGSIGVNPSGERVEGYSSPLQFLLFSGFYALFHLHYDLYFRLIAGVAAFLMGGLLYTLCLPHRMLGVVLVPLAAFALTRDWSFFEWHASGMENALTHGSFLLAVVVLVRMYETRRIRYGYVIPVLAALFARIESIYHIAPLLLIFAVYWFFDSLIAAKTRKKQESATSFPRTWESRTRQDHTESSLAPCERGDDVWPRHFGGLAFVGLTLALWGLLFCTRWYYFGSLFPNTAAAQSISISDRVGMMFRGDVPYLSQSWALTRKLFYWHHGMVLLPIAACIPFLRFTRKTVLAIPLLLSLSLTGLFSPFLFGAARLDVTRLSTQVALALIAMALVVMVHTRRPRYRYVTVPLMIVCVSGLLYWGHTKWEHKPYYLWFSENVFAKFRNELVDLREKHAIPRPTLANPDLGLMSWHKDFNIVDMGYLGNPVLTRLDALPDEGKAAIANYFFDIAAPDLIELHGIWSERHAHLFKDPRFRENYEAARTSIDGLLRKRFNRSANFQAEYGEYVRAGYWVRRDMMAHSDSRERALVDDLHREISLKRLEQELNDCVAQSLTPTQSFYVVRTAYRFIPEFVQQGLYTELVELLERYQPQLGYSTALLRGRADRNWANELAQYIETYSFERNRRRMERDYEDIFSARRADSKVSREITNGLRLLDGRLTPTKEGWGKLQLLFTCSRPIEKNWKIYVHASVPAKKRILLPKKLRTRTFINWDFGFPDPPTSQWHEYPHVVLTQYVPYCMDVNSIRVGLYRPGEGALGKSAALSLPRLFRQPEQVTER